MAEYVIDCALPLERFAYFQSVHSLGLSTGRRLVPIAQVGRINVGEDQEAPKAGYSRDYSNDSREDFSGNAWPQAWQVTK